MSGFLLTATVLTGPLVAGNFAGNTVETRYVLAASRVGDGSYYTQKDRPHDGECYGCDPLPCPIAEDTPNIEYTYTWYWHEELKVGAEADFLKLGFTVSEDWEYGSSHETTINVTDGCFAAPCDTCDLPDAMSVCGCFEAGERYCYDPHRYGFVKYIYDLYIAKRQGRVRYEDGTVGEWVDYVGGCNGIQELSFVKTHSPRPVITTVNYSEGGVQSALGGLPGLLVSGRKFRELSGPARTDAERLP